MFIVYMKNFYKKVNTPKKSLIGFLAGCWGLVFLDNSASWTSSILGRGAGRKPQKPKARKEDPEQEEPQPSEVEEFFTAGEESFVA